MLLHWDTMKSHRNVTPRQEALAERNLYTALAALKSAEECRAFLRDLCNLPRSRPWRTVGVSSNTCRRELPYREIHRLTGVSVTTIGRVARFLPGGNGGYEVAAKRIGASPVRRSGKEDSRHG